MNFNQQHSRTLARLATWICFLTLAILSLVPGELRPHTGLSGKIEHALAYAATGVVFAFGYLEPRQRIIGAASFASVALLFEAAQNLVPGRSPDIRDAMASAGGFAIGLGLGVIAVGVVLRSSELRTTRRQGELR